MGGVPSFVSKKASKILRVWMVLDPSKDMKNILEVTQYDIDEIMDLSTIHTCLH